MRLSLEEFLMIEARLNQKRNHQEKPNGEPVERDLHSKIAAECRTRGWICFHGSMVHRAMRTLGEPDFTILAEDGLVLLIEVKSKSGKLRPEQSAVIAWAKKLNHDIHVIRSMEEFLELIRTLLASRNRPLDNTIERDINT